MPWHCLDQFQSGILITTRASLYLIEIYEILSASNAKLQLKNNQRNFDIFTTINHDDGSVSRYKFSPSETFVLGKTKRGFVGFIHISRLI